MSYRFEFLEDVALADVAFRVEAGSWDELFAGAALVTTRVMLGEAAVAPAVTKEIELAQETVEDLFFSWLAEIVYLKDSELLLIGDVEVHVSEADPWTLRATIRGDNIGSGTRGLGQDVKAVTYHLFKVWREGPQYFAQVVLDI